MYKRIFRFVDSIHFEYLLLVIIVVAGFVVRLYKFQSPLADWHSWRQADTASVTRIYVNEGVNLLYPRYYDISSVQSRLFNPNGYRFVEFPIYNLFHTVSHRLFSGITFEASGRLVTIMATLISGLCLYYVGKTVLGKWGGLLSAFYFLLLPYNVYFGRVILPDPLAVMFALLAVVIMILFTNTKRASMLYLSAVLFSLALLVKPHAVFFGIPLAYLIFRKYPMRRVLQSAKFWLAAVLVILPVVTWRAWIMAHPEGIPLWQWSFNGDGIRFRPSFWRWIFGERLAKIILGFWGLIPFSFGVMTLKKKIELVHVFLLASLLYMVIFATANVKHDYYQIFVIPSVALALSWGTLVLWKADLFDVLLRRTMLIFSVGMMFMMSLFLVKDQFQIINDNILRAGETADRILPKDSHVIAPYNGDTAFLYQTRRFGWPVVTGSIDDMISQGADYYVSVSKHDTDTLQFRKLFVTLEETDEFIILDLHQRLSL